MAALTGTEMIAKFREMVGGDALDSTLELQLVNDAKEEIEEEIQPEILKKKDTSQSTTSGQTYATSIALPADFFLPYDFIMVGTTKVWQIPFDRQVEFRDIGGYFWIDHANSVYYLTGTQGSAQTITFIYWRKTDDIAAGTSPVWPSRFHPIIPLKMAKMFFAIDRGQRSDSWRPEWDAEYTYGLNRMRDWDHKLKLQAINRQTPYGAETSRHSARTVDLT